MRIELGGYKTGPALDFIAKFDHGSFDVNTMSEIKIMLNEDAYEENIQFLKVR